MWPMMMPPYPLCPTSVMASNAVWLIECSRWTRKCLCDASSFLGPHEIMANIFQKQVLEDSISIRNLSGDALWLRWQVGCVLDKLSRRLIFFDIIFFLAFRGRGHLTCSSNLCRNMLHYIRFRWNCRLAMIMMMRAFGLSKTDCGNKEGRATTAAVSFSPCLVVTI